MTDRDKLIAIRAEIERHLEYSNNGVEYAQMGMDSGLEHYKNELTAWQHCQNMCRQLLSFINSLEVKEVDLYNNGWIDCTKQMPQETKQTSDTLQGHREWTESDRVLVWDSMYGCSVDATKNGKWMSEQRGGYTGQVVHGIIAWRPIPEFSEELLLKAQKGE